MTTPEFLKVLYCPHAKRGQPVCTLDCAGSKRMYIHLAKVPPMELYYLLRNDTRLMTGLKLPLVRSSVSFSFNGKKYVEKKEKKKKK